MKNALKGGSNDRRVGWGDRVGGPEGEVADPDTGVAEQSQAVRRATTTAISPNDRQIHPHPRHGAGQCCELQGGGREFCALPTEGNVQLVDRRPKQHGVSQPFDQTRNITASYGHIE